MSLAVIATVTVILGKHAGDAAGISRVIKVGESALEDLTSDKKVAQFDPRTDGARAMEKGVGIYVDNNLGRRGSQLIHEAVHTGTKNVIRDRNWGGRYGAYDDGMKRRAAATRPDQAATNADNWVSAMGVDE